MFNTFEQDKEYLWNKFRKPVFDESTGLDTEAIKKRMETFGREMDGVPRPIAKAKAFEFVCRNIRIDVNPRDWFVGFACWNRYDRPLSPLIGYWDREVSGKYLKCRKVLDENNQAGTTNTWKDFDHSVPDWDAVFSLGFPGLRNRAKACRAEHEKNGTLTEEAKAYFEGIDITYAAMLEMLDRFRNYARHHANGNDRVLAVAKCLDTLIEGAPTNVHECLSLIYLTFIFGEHIDCMQVRSLGNLDRMLYPFYRKDLDDKRFTEEQIREFFAYFLMQWASINNYWGHPFYLGGTKENGETEVNELTYLILDVFDKRSIVSPKIQLKIAANTPDRFLDTALDMIRRGNSSLVFVGEESIRRAMMAAGHTAEEARTCAITGCYEFAASGRENDTLVGHINMLKPFELIFHDGIDPKTGFEVGVRTGPLGNLKTFDDFFSAYLKQLDRIIETIITLGDDFEPYLHLINPAQIYSATIANSLKTAKDAFSNGCVFNNSAILNAGFGTAIDALMAIKEFVYDRRARTLGEFKAILGDNWKGEEKLRLKIRNSVSKYGNGIDSVDSYAEKVARFISNKINMRPNARGGVYLASLHSAKQYVELGLRTGATPDGRFAGDEMSKNASPTMGADVSGVTALIKSAIAIDSEQFPGDFPLDVMMHPATVRGREGLDAMRGLVRTYLARHGIAIHFNIFDADVLLDAQAHPEKYAGLQIRVCGWNIHFTDMSKKEQDAFIERAKSIRE